MNNHMNEINEEFGQKLLEQMKEDKIAPKPRWRFLLKKYVVWGSGAIALIVGGLATSVIIYFLQDNSLNVYQRMDGSALKFIFFTLPYFWLIFLVFFIFALYYNLKHTGKGYRYSIAVVAAVSVLVSLLLGAILFQMGVGRLIDDILGEANPLYSSVFNQSLAFWDAPEDGRLAGLVVSQNSPTEFILLDVNRQAWRVITEPDHFFLPGAVEAGRPARIIGVKIEDNVFQAHDVFPIGPGRNFFHRFKDDPHFQPLDDDQSGGDILIMSDDFLP